MTSTSHDAALAAPAEDLRSSFDGLSMALHWASVLLVLAQFATAWSIDHVEPALAATLLMLHRSSGITLWALVVLRLVWRLTGMRKPPLPATMKREHVAGVRLSEYGLYALLLVQPATGMLDSVFRGRAFKLFLWSFPALMHRNRPYAALAHTAHEVGAYALAALVGLHALAALAHHFVLKDGVLLGMLPMRRRPKP
jgi:cytochrome b561